MYSAIKVNGRKLYEYARAGKQVEVPVRQVEIYNIDITNIDLNNNSICIVVNCSKGTYIRSLCQSIGEKLGTVATMSSLKRIKSGNFRIEDSIELESVNSNTKLITMEELFKESSEVLLTQEEKIKMLNGVKLHKNIEDGICRMYQDDIFLGLGIVCNNMLKRKIIV